MRECTIDRVDTVLRRYSDDLPEKTITDETFDGYKNKLKGRLFGLLCEREKGGEWEKFLDSIILELRGLGANSINWWPLLGKLSVLRYLSYEYFRKTIFECMNLISKLDIPDDLS